MWDSRIGQQDAAQCFQDVLDDRHAPWLHTPPPRQQPQPSWHLHCCFVQVECSLGIPAGRRSSTLVACMVLPLLYMVIPLLLITICCAVGWPSDAVNDSNWPVLRLKLVRVFAFEASFCVSGWSSSGNSDAHFVGWFLSAPHEPLVGC
jgi:hypothetical protein